MEGKELALLCTQLIQSGNNVVGHQFTDMKNDHNENCDPLVSEFIDTYRRVVLKQPIFFILLTEIRAENFLYFSDSSQVHQQICIPHILGYLSAGFFIL